MKLRLLYLQSIEYTRFFLDYCGKARKHMVQ